MTKENLEQAFDQAFDDAVASYSAAPDPTASWQKMERRLHKRNKRRNRLKMIPYIAASFILGAFIFGTPVVTEAFTPLYKTIINIQNDVVTLFFGSNESSDTTAKTQPPPNDENPSANHDSMAGENISKSFPSWEEAVAFVAFEPVMINYVPAGFTLSEVQLMFSGNQELANEAVLLYTKDQSRFRVGIRLLDSHEIISSNSQSNSTSLENVHINGAEAYLTVSDDGRALLEYLLLNMYVSITGNLSKEEIVQIANHIK